MKITKEFLDELERWALDDVTARGVSTVLAMIHHIRRQDKAMVMAASYIREQEDQIKQLRDELVQLKENLDFAGWKLDYSVKQAVSEEREMCAKIAESALGYEAALCTEIAKAIRSRGGDEK